MNFFKRKRNIIILVIVIIVVIAIFRCSQKSPVLPVQTSELKRGVLNEYVRTDGQLEPFIDVEISSDIMGKCERILVEEGAAVKKGQRLIEIDNTSEKATLNQSKYALAVAKSNYNYKKFLYENQKKLFSDSLISYSEYNMAKLEYENALSSLESAKASFEIAEDRLAKTVITSPIEGIVSGLYVEEGENIITGTMNNAGTVLMTVSDYGRMLVKSDVDETSVVKIKKGNKVEITFDAYPDTAFTGTVIQIAKRPGKFNEMSDEGTVYEVEILLDGKYDLLAGFNCEVSIITASKQNILQAPIQSIVNRMGREGVLTVENSTVRFIPAKPGIIGKDFIEIKSDSLEEGMKVVSGPFSSIKRLNDNDRVIDREFTGKPGLNKKQ